MTKRLQRLKQQRGVIQASATKLLQTIKEETSEDDVNCDRLRGLLSMLSVKEKSLMELERDIEEETPLEKLEADMAESLEYQDNITFWRGRAERIIEGRGAKAGTPGGGWPPVKLPELHISKCDGEMSTWQEFWDQYETAVCDNGDMSKADKLAYLRSYIVCPAARAIAQLTDERDRLLEEARISQSNQQKIKARHEDVIRELEEDLSSMNVELVMLKSQMEKKQTKTENLERGR